MLKIVGFGDIELLFIALDIPVAACPWRRALQTDHSSSCPIRRDGKPEMGEHVALPIEAAAAASNDRDTCPGPRLPLHKRD